MPKFLFALRNNINQRYKTQSNPTGQFLVCCFDQYDYQFNLHVGGMPQTPKQCTEFLQLCNDNCLCVGKNEEVPEKITFYPG